MEVRVLSGAWESPAKQNVSAIHRGGWEVRWRDGEGRKRASRYADEREARELDAKMARLAPAKRAQPLGRGHSPGVYSYVWMILFAKRVCIPTPGVGVSLSCGYSDDEANQYQSR